MDPREQLQSMLTNLINGDETSASEAVHQYIVAKARELASNPQTTNDDDE